MPEPAVPRCECRPAVLEAAGGEHYGLMPQFVVLRNGASDRLDLFTEDQVARATAAGYDAQPEFTIDGPTRAFARCAWDSQRGNRPYVYSDELDGHYGLEPLTSTERLAVVDFVRALVDRDRDKLAAAGAFEGGSDPYLWTSPYGRRERVDVQMPPGAHEHWSGGVQRVDTTHAEVVIDLWTAQEEPSDLSLQVGVDTSTDKPHIRFRDLHVM